MNNVQESNNSLVVYRSETSHSSSRIERFRILPPQERKLISSLINKSKQDMKSTDPRIRKRGEVDFNKYAKTELESIVGSQNKIINELKYTQEMLRERIDFLNTTIGEKIELNKKIENESKKNIQKLQTSVDKLDNEKRSLQTQNSKIRNELHTKVAEGEKREQELKSQLEETMNIEKLLEIQNDSLKSEKTKLENINELFQREIDDLNLKVQEATKKHEEMEKLHTERESENIKNRKRSYQEIRKLKSSNRKLKKSLQTAKERKEILHYEKRCLTSDLRQLKDKFEETEQTNLSTFSQLIETIHRHINPQQQ